VVEPRRQLRRDAVTDDGEEADLPGGPAQLVEERVPLVRPEPGEVEDRQAAHDPA
jgi:hypothetical protein